MPEFMMLMKGGEKSSSASDWELYIERLSTSGMFRGGSALGNGVCLRSDIKSEECTVSGYMRFEAPSIERVIELVPGNPVLVSGGEIEVLEIVET